MIKHIEIKNTKERILRGYLDIPDNAKHIVVMFHGFTGNKTEHNGYFRSFSRDLSALGIASLRMDYSCNGESDGEFFEFLFDEAISDAKLMLDFANSLPNIDEISILGYSMGGLVAAMVCNYLPITKLLLWSPSKNLYTHLQSRYDKVDKLENGNIYLAGNELNQAFITSLANINPDLEIKKLICPTLIIHGNKDAAVNYLEGLEYANKIANSQVFIINGATHGYDLYEHRLQLFKRSIDFLKKP